MTKFNSFEEIVAWQKAEKLAVNVYSAVRVCKDFDFKDQIQRAAISVSNNIAEGYERNGDKEFRNFLFIAKGSCAEVRSMLHLSVKMGYIPREQAMKLYDNAEEISKILSGLIKTL